MSSVIICYQWIAVHQLDENFQTLWRNLFDWELDEIVELLELLQKQRIDINLEDEWSWKWNSDGCFSVKSLAFKLSSPGSAVFPAKEIWNSTIPSKSNFLVWTMALDKCLSRSNLERRGTSSFWTPLVVCVASSQKLQTTYAFTVRFSPWCGSIS